MLNYQRVVYYSWNEILLGCSSQEVFLVKTNLKESPNCKGSPDLDRSTPRTNDDRQSLASSFHHGLDLICHVMLWLDLFYFSIYVGYFWITTIFDYWLDQDIQIVSEGWGTTGNHAASQVLASVECLVFGMLSSGPSGVPGLALGHRIALEHAFSSWCSSPSTTIYIYNANTRLITSPPEGRGVPSDWFSWPSLNNKQLWTRKLWIWLTSIRS